MFRNLNAEQSRHSYTNSDTAEHLGISRVSYENKKKSGRRKVKQVETQTMGKDPVRQMIDSGLAQSEKTAAYQMARQIQDQLDAGQGIIPGQLSAMQNHLSASQHEAQDKMRAARRKAMETYDEDVKAGRIQDTFRDRMANSEAQTEEYTQAMRKRGKEETSEAAKKKFSLTPELMAANTPAGNHEIMKDRVSDVMTDLGLNNAEAKNIVTNVVTGYMTDVRDLDSFSPNGGTEAQAMRTAFTEMTGKELPDTVEGTQEVIMDHLAQQAYAAEENNKFAFKVAVMSQAVQDTADDLGDEAAHLLEDQLINDNVDVEEVEQYTDAFRSYYTGGGLGLTFDQQNGAAAHYARQLEGSSMPQVAYEAGLARHTNEETERAVMERSRKKSETKKKTTKKRAKKKGTFTDNTTANAEVQMSEKDKKILKALAEKIGVDIVLEDTITEKGANGNKVQANGYYKEGVIHIAADTEDPYITTFKHELTHHLQKTAPEEYKALRDFIRDKWYEGSEEALKKAITAKINTYGGILTPDQALDEILADAAEAFFTDNSAINEVIQANRSLGEKILDWIRNLIADIKAMMAEMAKTDSEFKATTKELADLGILEEAEKKWAKALAESVQSDVDVEGGETRFSIKEGMTDQERYDELKDEKIDIVAYKPENMPTTKEDLEALKTQMKRDAFPVLKKLATKLGITDFEKAYKTQDLEIEFYYSNNRLDESAEKQVTVKTDGKYILMSQLLTCFDEVIANARLVEVHSDRYAGTQRENPDFVRSYILLSAFQNDSGIVPVKLLIKEYRKEKNTLHVSIALPEIKRADQRGQANQNGQRSPLSVLSDYNLSDLLRDVKRIDDDVENGTGGSVMGKYIPAQFSQTQQDADYMKAVNAGDMETAQKMVDEAAEAAMPASILRDKNGKLLKMYHGSGAKGFYKFNMRDGAMGYGAYFSSSFTEAAEYALFSSEEIEQDDNWDYVWNGETWGRGEIEEELEEQGYIRSFYLDVRERHNIDGNINDQYGITAVVRNREQIKSADPVTYDDNGKVIPLSERFNDKSEDIRFSLKEPVEETKDLLALHNLSDDELLKSIKLGGVVMPSIAIRREAAHTSYGSVSLLFDKATIDPQRDPANKVYGGDAWTPTFPRVEYPVDMHKLHALDDRIYELSKSIAGGEFASSMSLIEGIVGDTTSDTEKQIADSLANKEEIQAAYLADQGVEIEPVMREKSYDQSGNQLLADLINAFGGKKYINDIKAKLDQGERLSDEDKETIRNT